MALSAFAVVRAVRNESAVREFEMAKDGPENPHLQELPATKTIGGARADFVAGLGRKVSELRSVLAALEASPRATSVRDELRRKLHALGASARLLHFGAVAATIGEAEEALAGAVRSEPLGASELGTVVRALDDLPALAFGDSAPLPRKDEDATNRLPAPGISALVVGPAALSDALTERSGEPGELSFVCERTDDAETALGLARDLAPDVVLVDTDVEGAPEVVEALFDDPLTEPVPIVVIGSFSNPEQAARFVALGVARTLARPVAASALRRACRDVIDQREGRTMPIVLGELTVEQLGERLADEMKRAIVDSVDRAAQSCRVPLGEGAEVVGALWGAIARVREVITLRTNGAVRYTGGGPEGAVPLAPWLHPDVAGSERQSEPARGRGGAPEVSLDRRVVVVADDDPGVTWFISDLLRTLGCVVHEALDGASALRLSYELSPELVVSDILMPGLDGFALCRALRRDVALRDTPVILLSWKEDLLQRVRELGASAAAYLRKESDARAIVARVREVLRPRARVEARLRAEGEVRGRLDGLTVHSLLRLVAAIRPSARLLVRDASFLYEVDLRGGVPQRATRTSVDGAFHHGERVLGTLLGVGSGRFVVTSLPPTHLPSSGGELVGSLADQLARPTARARAALLATTGANTMAVRSIVIDDEMVKGYVSATPEPARSLVQRLALGESPRDILLRGEISPTILEVVLADLAARGAIVGVRGDGGQDLLRAEGASSEAPSSKAPIKDSWRAPRPTPSPLPTSDLVARELPLVRDMALRRAKPGKDSEPPAGTRPDTGAPSSLEDAVMRAMSESPSTHPPSPRPPSIVEPSELRPRSSNPPAEPGPTFPSLPPDAVVPAAASGEMPIRQEEGSKTEPTHLPEREPPPPPVEVSIPIEFEASKPIAPPAASSLASSVASSVASSGTSSGARAVAPPVASSLAPGRGPPPAAPKGPAPPPGPSWKPAAIVVGACALLAVGGLHWLAPSGATSEPTLEPLPSDPDVTYGDIPAGVTVPSGQGLLEIGAHAGEPVRIDGTDAGAAPASGTLRRPAAIGTHMIHAGPSGAERSRIIEVRAGRTTHVALDGP
jgi:CheY-like chemotaxis protein